MSTTECKGCGGVDTSEQTYSEYVPCLYERPFLIGSIVKNRLGQERRWKSRIIVSVFLYLSILVLFYAGIAIFNSYIENAQPYKYAAVVLASLIFWPIIVIYDSELFYRTCKKLYCLLTPSAKTLDWYAESAKRYFCLFSEGEKPALGAIITNAVCSVLVIAIYVLKVYVPNFIPSIIGTPWPIIVCVTACSLTVFMQKRSRNLLVSMFTVCCGLSYYAYIAEYSSNKLAPLFIDGFVPGTVIIIGLICIVFFVAGSTLVPMLGLFKTFFMSDFENKISYPIDELACSLDTIQAIKKYFLHLTGVNLLAFFQLLGSVYLLGLLNTDSIITKVLFVMGSFFPVVMYLAASVFFKKLCHKIYILQVKNIDVRIYEGIKEDKLNADEIQALVAVKEMYANEFEIHAVMSKEILVAMLSPVATALAAVIFPASNILGG